NEVFVAAGSGRGHLTQRELPLVLLVVRRSQRSPKSPLPRGSSPAEAFGRRPALAETHEQKLRRDVGSIVVSGIQMNASPRSRVGARELRVPARRRRQIHSQQKAAAEDAGADEIDSHSGSPMESRVSEPKVLSGLCSEGGGAISVSTAGQETQNEFDGRRHQDRPQ